MGGRFRRGARVAKGLGRRGFLLPGAPEPGLGQPARVTTDLTARVTTDLTLLPRVAYRGQELTAPRLRGLLALLAGDLRSGCGSERLVEGLWPDELPERPAKAVQVLASRARSLPGADVITSTPTGYRLALAEEQADTSALLLHAVACADRAGAGDHAGSLAAAEAGIALWAGTPDGAGTTDDPVAALRAERAPVRGTLRTRAGARVAQQAAASLAATPSYARGRSRSGATRRRPDRWPRPPPSIRATRRCSPSCCAARRRRRARPPR